MLGFGGVSVELGGRQYSVFRINIYYLGIGTSSRSIINHLVMIILGRTCSKSLAVVKC